MPRAGRISLRGKGRRTGSERGLDPAQGVGDGVALGGCELALQGMVRRAGNSVAEASQLVETRTERRRGRIRGQLGERRVERDQDLEDGLAGASLVHVETGAQRELFAGQAGLATGEDRREPGLSRGDPAPAPPRTGIGQVARVGPSPDGHLLAVAVAEAGHQRVMATHPALVRVGGGDPERVKGTVEHGQPGRQVRLARSFQPRSRLLGARKRSSDVDNGGSGGLHQSRLRFKLSLMLTPSGDQMTPFPGSQRGQHEDMGGWGVRAVAVAADQVATVGRAERPRQLELAEAEDRDGRRLLPARVGGEGYCRPGLIAYLLGAIGTTGSLIWLRWLISFVHWLGCRMSETSADSFLFAP